MQPQASSLQEYSLRDSKAPYGCLYKISFLNCYGLVTYISGKHKARLCGFEEKSDYTFVSTTGASWVQVPKFE